MNKMLLPFLLMVLNWADKMLAIHDNIHRSIFVTESEGFEQQRGTWMQHEGKLGSTKFCSNNCHKLTCGIRGLTRKTAAAAAVVNVIAVHSANNCRPTSK